MDNEEKLTNPKFRYLGMKAHLNYSLGLCELESDKSYLPILMYFSSQTQFSGKLTFRIHHGSDAPVSLTHHIWTLFSSRIICHFPFDILNSFGKLKVISVHYAICTRGCTKTPVGGGFD